MLNVVIGCNAGRDKMELNLLLRVYPLQERLEMLEHCCAVWR